MPINQQDLFTSFEHNTVSRALSQVKDYYGTVWPLHSYNACNPLAGLENESFSNGLQLAQDKIGVELFPMLAILADTLKSKEILSHEVLSYLPQELNIEQEQLQAMIQAELLGASSFSSPPYRLKKRVKLEHNENKESTEEKEAFILSDAYLRWLDTQMCRWLSLYFDDGQAIWAMPKSMSKGQPQLLVTWSDLVVMDSSLPSHLKKHLKEIVNRVICTTQPPSHTLVELAQLTCPKEELLEELLNHHAKNLPGWFGYLKYLHTLNPEEEIIEQYFCIRLAYQYALKQQEWVPAVYKHVQHPPTRYDLLNQGASLLKGQPTFSQDQMDVYLKGLSQAELIDALLQCIEENEQAPLLAELHHALTQTTLNHPVQEQLLLQAVFCIDVRSEPYRKALEKNGSNQVKTLGFAGFFGLPIARHTNRDDAPVPLCPILLEPSYTISNKVMGSQGIEQDGFLNVIPLRKQQWQLISKKIKRDSLATFGYVEALGVIHGWTMFRDSFIKPMFSQGWKSLKKAFTIQTEPCLKTSSHNTKGHSDSIGMSLDEQIQWAVNTLPLVGFDKGTLAKVVLVCGHGSHSTNNPYASSLDCGACGANDGTFNSAVFCKILNTPKVRQAINEQTDFTILDETLFVPARHNTTESYLDVLLPELGEFSEPQKDALLAVKKLVETTNQETQQTVDKLPDSVSYQPHTSQAAYDWSNTRPEWGLSSNQAFIIGDRDRTKDLALNGRAFLHSYDWQRDPEGQILEVILTAPAIVGSWINLQYLFSTLHNKRFGSGKKYTHNVSGLLGTYQGNMSDLQMGLPYESLFNNDGSPFHTPQRLMLHVTAPLERVQRILSQHASIRHLVQNKWIRFVVFDPESKEATTF